MNLNTLMILCVLCAQCALADDKVIPKLEDVKVDIGKKVIWSETEIRKLKESGKIAPDLVNKFALNESYTAILKVLGNPFAKEHLINIDQARKIDPENALWLVVYRHATSDNIYYQMSFSGANRAPDRLLAIDVIVMHDGRKLEVGRLLLAEELKSQKNQVIKH
jgi:hypothetical protein